MSERSVEEESAAGWTIRCDQCGKEETFLPVVLGDALIAINTSGRWPRLAPMMLQSKDYCGECVEGAKR